MATLRETLRSNPYADIFVPLIENFQSANAAPHVKLGAALMINKALETFPAIDVEDANYPVIGGLIDPSGPSGIPAPVDPCLVASGGSGVGGGVLAALGLCGSGIIAPPTANYTDASYLKTLKRQLSSVDATISNAWSYFNQAVDTFYGNVDVLDYFMSFEKGAYRSLYLNALSIGVLDGTQFDGIIFEVTQQGTGALPQIFTLDFNKAILDNLAGRYFVAYKDVNRKGFWFEVDGNGTEPVIAGVVSSHKIVIDTSLSNNLNVLALDTVLKAEIVADSRQVGGGILQYTYGSVGEIGDVEPGTAGVGATAAIEDLVASDDTILETGIVTDEAFQDAYNGKLVPYEKSLGNTIPYVKSLSVISEGDCCKSFPRTCCPKGGLFLFTTRNAVTKDIIFK